MVHPVTAWSSSLLMEVNQWANIRKDDGSCHIGAKMLMSTCAKVIVCVLSALECIICAALSLLFFPIAPISLEAFSTMARRTASAGRNVFQALSTIFHVHTTHLDALSWGKAHTSTVKAATSLIAIVTVAYALYHRSKQADAIATIFNSRLFSLLGYTGIGASAWVCFCGKCLHRFSDRSIDILPVIYNTNTKNYYYTSFFCIRHTVKSADVFRNKQGVAYFIDSKRYKKYEIDLDGGNFQKNDNKNYYYNNDEGQQVRTDPDGQDCYTNCLNHRYYRITKIQRSRKDVVLSTEGGA